jgi:hypothetical protein
VESLGQDALPSPAFAGNDDRGAAGSDSTETLDDRMHRLTLRHEAFNRRGVVTFAFDAGRGGLALMEEGTLKSKSDEGTPISERRSG